MPYVAAVLAIFMRKLICELIPLVIELVIDLVPGVELGISWMNLLLQSETFKKVVLSRLSVYLLLQMLANIINELNLVYPINCMAITELSVCSPVNRLKLH